MSEIRTRFAPSPTGFMHVGNLRTALYAWLLARSGKGSFVLRIEDTDQNRYVEGAVEIIYSTLKQAGIDHDEGPDNGGQYGPYIQSERKPLYKEYAEKLVELQPRCKIVFCTGHEEYAVSAFQLHVSGYLIKPITSEAVQKEIDHIKGVKTSEKLLTIKCFGNFVVFHNGEILSFKRKKAKEFLAVLNSRNQILIHHI